MATLDFSTTSCKSQSDETASPTQQRTVPAFVLPAEAALERFGSILSDLDLLDQPDLGGMILGNVLKMQQTKPGFDASTAAMVLGEVGRSIRQWRSEWEHNEMCPLCDTTA